MKNHPDKPVSQEIETAEEISSEILAQVVPLGGGKIGKSLLYRIPEKLESEVKIGSVAAIGVRKTIRLGVVVGFESLEDAGFESPDRIKPISAVYTDEKILGEEQVKIARWMSGYYACSLRDAFSPLTPEVRALQPVSLLVTNDTERLLSEVASLGLLFSDMDVFKFEERNGGFSRISNTELENVLLAGGLTEEKAAEIISGWIESGVLGKEIEIRTRISQIGSGSYLALTESGSNADLSSLRSGRQRQILELLTNVGGILSRDEIMREISSAATSLNGLLKKGLVEEIVDVSLVPDTALSTAQFMLSDAQSNAVRSISEALEKREKKTFLLFGVTGSGKTEVYIETCRKALKLGKRATVIVPEIALTHQAVRRFMQAFPGRIALFHSELTERERLHEWRAVRRGTRDIVIGARSALFVPVDNRGLIIIDEESENAYKQHQKPRYHAREVARAMSKSEGSVVVLGSATPSVESFYHATTGNYELLRLPSRVVGGELPEVRVVRPDPPSDTAEKIIVEGKEVRIGLMSAILRDELAYTLKIGRQALLFLNQRGFSRSLICPACGWVPHCPECDVALTYHRKNHMELCHHCGFRKPSQKICGKCRHEGLHFLGYGTERLEAEVSALFPKAKILRMDRDTVGTRGRRRSIVESMLTGEVDVLLGTQMIAKGLDFPSVRLVGVISADASLHIPDFRAAERTFQLITQVAGRAGRSDALGREGGGIAIVQSFDPHNRVLDAATRQDFEKFYDMEIVMRQKFGYPPSTRLARILITGPDLEMTREVSNRYRIQLEKTRTDIDLSFAGPAPAPLERLEGRWRYHFILKSPSVNRLVRWISKAGTNFKFPAGIKLEIDIDPISMM